MAVVIPIKAALGAGRIIRRGWSSGDRGRGGPGGPPGASLRSLATTRYS